MNSRIVAVRQRITGFGDGHEVSACRQRFAEDGRYSSEDLDAVVVAHNDVGTIFTGLHLQHSFRGRDDGRRDRVVRLAGAGVDMPFAMGTFWTKIPIYNLAETLIAVNQVARALPRIRVVL